MNPSQLQCKPSINTPFSFQLMSRFCQIMVLLMVLTTFSGFFVDFNTIILMAMPTVAGVCAAVGWLGWYYATAENSRVVECCCSIEQLRAQYIQAKDHANLMQVRWYIFLFDHPSFAGEGMGRLIVPMAPKIPQIDVIHLMISNHLPSDACISDIKILFWYDLDHQQYDIFDREKASVENDKAVRLEIIASPDGSTTTEEKL